MSDFEVSPIGGGAAIADLPAPVPAGIDTTHDIEAETAGRKG